MSQNKHKWCSQNMNIKGKSIPNMITITDEGCLVSCTPIWCSCRWDGRSVRLLTWGQSRCPCGSGLAADRATRLRRDGWGALRTYRMTQVERCHHWIHEAEWMEAVWRKETSRFTQMWLVPSLRLLLLSYRLTLSWLSSFTTCVGE